MGRTVMAEENMSETTRQVLIGVSLALIAAARIDPTTVSTLLLMFANGNAPNKDAKTILREIAAGVQVLGKKAGLKMS
jgi:hypothetical protein